MAFVLNIFRGEKKDNLGFLPRSGKTVDRKAKKNDLEDIADEFMRKEEYSVQSDKYGVTLDPNTAELAEDVPHEIDLAPADRFIRRTTMMVITHLKKTTPIRWQKGGVLGVGAFGKVFMGLNLDTGELIAVKQISLEGQQRREVEAVEHEVNLLRNLRHENIVMYFGTSVEENTLNIFLEYVPGGSISSLLQKFGKFSEPVIQVYTKQLLLGLEYLHRHQIVHRDIKGANILVDNSGTIKLADFGASKTIEGLKNRNMTMSGIKGTPLWMAPEVIKQIRHGRHADIWSVGCTVIEMATGQPPWVEFTDQVSALFHIGSSNDIPRIPEFLSAEGKDFLHSCLKREPKKRLTVIKLLEHTFVAKSSLPSERSPGSSEASSRASYSPGLSRQLSRDNIHDSPKNLSIRHKNGSETNSGSSTPARRLLPVPSSSGASPRDSPSATMRRHNLSTSQLDDTCDDEPSVSSAKR